MDYEQRVEPLLDILICAYIFGPRLNCLNHFSAKDIDLQLKRCVHLIAVNRQTLLWRNEVKICQRVSGPLIDDVGASFVQISAAQSVGIAATQKRMKFSFRADRMSIMMQHVFSHHAV